MDPIGGTVYIAIGQVKDISGPALTRGDIDATTHDSTLGYKEFLPGLVDGGVITFPINFVSQNLKHLQGVGTGLAGDMERDGCLLATWELTLSDCAGTPVWTWAGYVNGYNVAAPVEGVNTSDISIKVSGKPTLEIS